MKVNQQNPKRSNKNVSFSTMETIQRQGYSIDKLTSLMNEESTKLYRKESTVQYKPKIFQGRNRRCRQRQDRYGSRDRSYNRECGPYNGNRWKRQSE